MKIILKTRNSLFYKKSGYDFRKGKVPGFYLATNLSANHAERNLEVKELISLANTQGDKLMFV